MKNEYIEAQVVSLTRRIHPQDLGEETSKLENILRQALEDTVAEERERIRGMKPCRFGCYCKLCGLCDAETMIHCGDCVMNKPISLLASLDTPLPDKE